MFKKAKFCTVLIIGVVLAMTIFKITGTKQPPVLEMTLEEAQHPAHQKRHDVQKDIWLADNAQRLHYRIDSPRSTLTMLPTEKGHILIEKMDNLNGYIQEKLDDNRQQIRHIQAASGTYYYLNNQFYANSVTIALHDIPGHDLITALSPEDAFLKGIASDVSFSFADHHPNFHAQKFKAKVKLDGTTSQKSH